MAKIIVESEEAAVNIARILVNAANIVRDCPIADEIDKMAIPDVLCLLRDTIKIEE